MSSIDRPQNLKQTKVFIGLDNPKSPTNVGVALRAAGCFRVDAVFYTGERYARAVKFNTDTKNQHRHIPLSSVASLLDCVDDDVKIVCVEFAEGAAVLQDYRHPDKACYIFGPEDGTLEQELIDRADAVVYIPTAGCMNLAAAINVVLYDRMCKSKSRVCDDDFIRTYRDTNNKVRSGTL